LTNLIILKACEQLNAWLGGYQTVLNKMTAGNFNWFLHSMLFLHTERVILKQQQKAQNQKEKERTEQESDYEDGYESEEVGIDIDVDED
jgi:hypothetical protein